MIQKTKKQEQIKQVDVEVPEITEAKATSPVLKCVVRPFETAVFLHEGVTKQGVRFKTPSVQLQKSWTKDGKKWERQKISFFNVLEIEKAIYCLSECKKAIFDRSFEEGAE